MLMCMFVDKVMAARRRFSGRQPRRRSIARHRRVSAYVRLWPREVLDVREKAHRKGEPSFRLDELRKHGLYVLYRQGEP